MSKQTDIDKYDEAYSKAMAHSHAKTKTFAKGLVSIVKKKFKLSRQDARIIMYETFKDVTGNVL